MSESPFHIEMEGRKGRRFVAALIATFLVIWIGATCVFRVECESEIQAKAHETDGHVRVHDLGTSIYRGLQLFHLHDTHWPEPHGIAAYLVRYAAAAYALAFPAVLFGWFFRGGLARWRHQNWGRDFVVIAGDAAGAHHLVLDLARNKRKVVWAKQRSGHDADGDDGVLVIEGDMRDASYWKNKVRIKGATDIVVMTGEDTRNIELSLILEDALRGKRLRNSVRCHIDMGDFHLKKGLAQLLPTTDEVGLLSRRYFNKYEVMARLLARMQPLPVNVGENGTSGMHYIIVGFGQLGQNVALKLAKMGQQVVPREVEGNSVFHVCKPRITVVDQRGDKAAEAFLMAHPGFPNICDFQVIAADCTDQDFLELRFLDQAPTARHTALIFCLGNEATVVSSVLMMSDTCRHLKNRLHAIYYHANHEHSAGHLLNREQMRLSQRVPIRIFALENEIFTEDVILNRSLDVMAQRIHLEYLKVTKSGIDSGNPAPAANKPWMDLSDDEREGNNEVADHLWAKLGTLGYALESLPHPRGEKTPVAPIDSALIGESIECNIEELASSEHYRWMAWRLVNGWTYGPVRDNEKKQHPDMVAYERLNEAGKEKDRAIVRIIPDLIRLGMLRMTKVAVPEDQTAPISSTSSQQG